MTCASGSAVEHLLAKEGVAGSIPVSRSFYFNGNPCFSRISVIFVHLKKWGHLRSFWGQLVFCFGKRTQGIYLCTACHFCDSITVSRFESSEKIDLVWMWGEFRSESRWLYLECTCTIVDFYNMHGYNICQQRIVRFLTTKIKLLQIVKYNWAGWKTRVHHTAGKTPAIYNNFRWI